MAVTIVGADAYIDLNVIDVEDWQASEDAHKQRILNVGARTLIGMYSDYVIPDEAVYELAAKLAVAYNDTNKLANQGIASFSVTGVASFTFKEGSQKLVDDEIKRIIGDANGVKLTGKHAIWTVM